MATSASQSSSAMSSPSRPLLKPAFLAQQNPAMPESEMDPLHPDIISRQATMNIGTIGHVNHGKSTLVEAISGVKTQRFQSERERNITIKLGYANAKIYKCTGGCVRPTCYFSGGSATPDDIKCEICSSPMKLLRHISFVDCPGHDVLMATMLAGAAVMDAALLLIAANESCPQPQTKEHLAAVEAINLRNLIILQNKIDLVQDRQAQMQCGEIERFVKGTAAEGAPIIPIVAQHGYNVNIVCEYIVNKIPVPVRNFSLTPRFVVIRSFDINKPGTHVDDLHGGIAGGSLIQGVFRLGDEIEVRPGIVRNRGTTAECMPVRSRIISMQAEENELAFAVPGGLIGMGTLMDPAITVKDRLEGMIIGRPGELPPVYQTVVIEYYLLRNLLGLQGKKGTTSEAMNDQTERRVKPITKGEILMFNIGSHHCGGTVIDTDESVAEEGAVPIKYCIVRLAVPVCADIGEKVGISRRIETHFRLIGWGRIVESDKAEEAPFFSI